MVNKQHDLKRQILSQVCYRHFVANTRTQQHCAEMRAVQPINTEAKRHYHNLVLQTNEEIYCTPTNTQWADAHWEQMAQQATSEPCLSSGCLKLSACGCLHGLAPFFSKSSGKNKLLRCTFLAIWDRHLKRVHRASPARGNYDSSSPSLAMWNILLPVISHCRPCHLKVAAKMPPVVCEMQCNSITVDQPSCGQPFAGPVRDCTYICFLLPSKTLSVQRDMTPGSHETWLLQLIIIIKKHLHGIFFHPVICYCNWDRCGGVPN